MYGNLLLFPENKIKQQQQQQNHFSFTSKPVNQRAWIISVWSRPVEGQWMAGIRNYLMYIYWMMHQKHYIKISCTHDKICHEKVCHTSVLEHTEQSSGNKTPPQSQVVNCSAVIQNRILFSVSYFFTNEIGLGIVPVCPFLLPHFLESCNYVSPFINL